MQIRSYWKTFDRTNPEFYVKELNKPHIITYLYNIVCISQSRENDSSSKRSMHSIDDSSSRSDDLKRDFTIFVNGQQERTIQRVSNTDYTLLTLIRGPIRTPFFQIKIVSPTTIHLQFIQIYDENRTFSSTLFYGMSNGGRFIDADDTVNNFENLINLESFDMMLILGYLALYDLEFINAQYVKNAINVENDSYCIKIDRRCDIITNLTFVEINAPVYLMFDDISYSYFTEKNVLYDVEGDNVLNTERGVYCENTHRFALTSQSILHRNPSPFTNTYLHSSKPFKCIFQGGLFNVETRASHARQTFYMKDAIVEKGFITPTTIENDKDSLNIESLLPIHVPHVVKEINRYVYTIPLQQN